MDNLKGTAGNDTFIADNTGTDPQLTAADQVDGGAGTDTLKIYNSAGALNGANFASAIVSGVENVELTALTTNVINVSGNADVKKVTLVNGADGVVTLNVNQTAGLKGAIDTAAAATFTFTNVAGSADVANVELDGADLATTGGTGLNIAGVETLNVTATGTNKLGTTAIDATKLVITGSGSVSATLQTAAAAASVTKTIDGSASTGNLTIDNSGAAAAVESIKTGSGNDTYTTVYANLTADDVIQMGTGTDSLRFSDATNFATAANVAKMAKVTGVEQLGTVSAALTVDGSLVTQTSFYTDGAAGAMTMTNLANNSSLNFGAGAILASTAGTVLGANTLSINLAGGNAAASDLTNGLTVTGSSTLNVNSTGTAGVANNVLAVTAADNQSIVLTGSQNTTITATAATGTTGFSIDASAFTGKATITGTAAADILKGGSGADTINLANSDTATGNGGADKFVVDITPAVGATAADFSAVMASITDFVTGTDTLKLSATAATTANFNKATTAVADFTAALAAADTVLNGTVVYSVQFVGTDAYVFFDADGTIAAANTEVVKLVGVGLSGFAITDITV